MQSKRKNDIAAFRIAHAARPVVLFDLDGTLVETDAANTAAYRDAFRLHGLAGLPVRGGRVTRSCLRTGCPALAEEDLRALVAAKRSAYAGRLALTRLGPAAGALRRVLARRDAFAKVVLLTESDARRAYETLVFHGLADCFDEVACNGGRGDKYHNYLARHDVDPAACLAYENETKKVLSALSAGIRIENIKKVA